HTPGTTIDGEVAKVGGKNHAEDQAQESWFKGLPVEEGDMDVQQVLHSEVSKSESREDQDQTQVDRPDHQGTRDGGLQGFAPHKIESKQKQDTGPDFGADRRGTSQGEREPEIVGHKGQKTNGHHHSRQDERTGSSQ